MSSALHSMERVLVAGGGIGGLSVANMLLQKAPHLQITVSERQTTYQTAEAKQTGVVLTPNAFHTLGELGFGDSLAQQGHPLLTQVISGEKGIIKELEFGENGYLGVNSCGTFHLLFIYIYIYNLSIVFVFASSHVISNVTCSIYLSIYLSLCSTFTNLG